MTDLSVIIVNWNGGDDLAVCVASIPAAAEGLAHEIIVVDNASTDGSTERIAAEFSQVRLVRNAINRGFSGGVNAGLDHANGQALLILNPDITLQAGTVCALLEYMHEHPKVGAIGAIFRGLDGNRQDTYVRKLPNIMQVLLFHTVLESWARRCPTLVDRYLQESSGGSEPRKVEQLPGAFLLTTRSLFDKVGRFDETFKLFYEDVDWSLRVQQADFDLILHQGISAVHRGGGTLHGEARDWVQGRLALSLMRYYDLHKSRLASWTVRGVLALNALLVVLFRSIQLLFSGTHSAAARTSRRRALYFLKIAFATYIVHEDVPLNPAAPS